MPSISNEVTLGTGSVGGLNVTWNNWLAQFDTTATYNPATGNLVVLTGGSFGTRGQPPTVQAGWNLTQLAPPGGWSSNFDYIYVVYKIWDRSVDSPGNITINSANGNLQYSIYDIAPPFDTSNPITQFAIASSATVSPVVGPSLTPAKVGALPIFVVQHIGGANSPAGPPSWSGATLDGYSYIVGAVATPSYVSTAHGALTVDTVTPISATCTLDVNNTTQTFDAIVFLVNPANTGITGTGAAAQAEQTVSASGLQIMRGPGAVAQREQKVSASGSVLLGGMGAITQRRQTVSARGFVTIPSQPPWLTKPLQDIIPAYPYEQYQDDPNIVAFFTAINTLGQAYLDWFNATPLSVYTSPSITGSLLDWIGQGIYGIPRPVFSNLSSQFLGAALNAVPLNTIAIDGSVGSSSGSAVVATDDFYKRVITWLTYMGDGRVFNATVLRKRIARFLYGVNGGDITLSQTQNVSVAVVTSPYVGYNITIPASANPASSYFEEGFNSGILTYPFQLYGTVNIV